MYYDELNETWEQLTAPGAPFEVEEISVRGIRVRQFKNMPKNVREVWLASAVFQDREYIVYQNERLTYVQAHAKVNAIASWLFSQGVRPGDRVAISMRNYPEWMLIYWACVSIGVAVVGLNAWWVADEMEFGLKDSAPKLIFCDKERLAILLSLQDIASNTKIVAVRAQSEDSIIAFDDVIAHTGEMADVSINPDSDACIFYTSGTTGFPKGAQLTHRSCVAHLYSMLFLLQVFNEATDRANGKVSAPVCPASLLATPLFHVTACNSGAYPVTALGGKIVFMRKWDAAEALRLIERERLTGVTGVPVMAREIIDHPDFEKTDTSTLIGLSGGGAALQPDLVAKIARGKKIPTTGYGMTEVCGAAVAITGAFFEDRNTSVGRASPIVEIRIVDDEGKDVPKGQVGELCMKSAQVIKGYLNRPKETAEAITNGWLHSGDLARIDDDGFIYIVDRKKEMVLRGGENVYCAEVEACIYNHQAVAEASVFSVPDERLGEEVGAAVVLRDGQNLNAGQLRAHCETHIAKYKVPRYIWVLKEPLPRNASGKFLKKQLQQSLKIQDAM